MEDAEAPFVPCRKCIAGSAKPTGHKGRHDEGARSGKQNKKKPMAIRKRLQRKKKKTTAAQLTRVSPTGCKSTPKINWATVNAWSLKC